MRRGIGFATSVGRSPAVLHRLRRNDQTNDVDAKYDKVETNSPCNRHVPRECVAEGKRSS